MKSPYPGLIRRSVDEDFALFHWSPTTRRNGINRRGFVPGSTSVDGMWKPPYTCWADDPALAWQLSGRIHPEITQWDLWETWTGTLPGVEEMVDYSPSLGRYYIKEFRVYTRIYKRNVWYVATRGEADGGQAQQD